MARCDAGCGVTRARNDQTMGLYDDLPDAKPRAATASTARDGDASDDGSIRDAKRAKRATGDVGERGEDAQKVQLRDDATVAAPSKATTTKDALQRIAQHLLKPEKFVKASGLLKKLLMSEACDRGDAKALFACLENAMTPTPKARALRAETRLDYEELFEIVAAFSPLIFNAKQKRKLEVWSTYARRINALWTDDSFEFTKAVKAIQEVVDRVDSYVEPPGVIEDDDIEIPPAPEGVSEEEATAMATSYTRSIKAERAAEIEQLAVVDELREALIDALEFASSLYGRTWSQTTIDMMSNFFHERRPKFSPASQERIVKIWDDLRKKKHARSLTSSVGDKLSMTSFERDQARAAGSQVSARGSVGAENVKDGRGESAAKMLG